MRPLGAIGIGLDFVVVRGDCFGPLRSPIGTVGVTQGFVVTRFWIDQLQSDVWTCGVAYNARSIWAGRWMPGVEFGDFSIFVFAHPNAPQRVWPVYEDDFVGVPQECFMGNPHGLVVFE